ncbi:Hypothetical protein DEACI_0865 [Acididesulfobacillus acetoxydans]|uniref:Uncharacterized protein n=1 Tax=Acididesulfobacillus acetoxydans TaxID=1561005 RepID=A0A8S0VVY3_9FIRM|nr:Hypothetical protein DEACI_0865 [Acididesulfobacillus acetoxydans]CEJ09591.1 Hypothetical protein DEACI_4076 [Acididesulfobacillus acetoxydans]
MNYPRLRFAKKRGLLGEHSGVGFLFHQPLPSCSTQGFRVLDEHLLPDKPPLPVKYRRARGGEIRTPAHCGVAA